MAKRNTKQDRIENPKDYMLHPTKGYRRARPWIRQWIREGEALFERLRVTQEKTDA